MIFPILVGEGEEIYKFDNYGYIATCIEPEYQPEINIVIDDINKKSIVIRDIPYKCNFPVEREKGPNFDLQYYKLENY